LIAKPQIIIARPQENLQVNHRLVTGSTTML